MDATQVYIAMSIAILAIIAIIAFFVHKEKKKALTTLTALSFAFVVAGIIFGGDRLIGYGLIGTGVILAIIDMITKLKSEKQKFGKKQK